MKNFRGGLVLFLFFIGVAFSLYGKSLPYEFVYDDAFRIVHNESIKTLAHPSRFFLDPSTQSSYTTLNQHAYRPLVTWGFAVDHALFGDNPVGYRFENILLHGINGFLIALLALSLFNLSLFGAMAAGLIFLVHPIQVEAVVWVVERSNIMSLTLMLSATLCWLQYLKKQQVVYAGGSLIFFIGSLLYREIAFCFPLMLIVIDVVFPNQNIFKMKRWRWLAVFFLIDILYFVVRWHFIGQVKIQDYWGGTWSTNLANVFRVWPDYIRSAICPVTQNVHPFQPYSAQILEKGVILGFFVFILTVFLSVLCWFKDKKISLCLILFLLFWMPGSGLIPHPAQFAERLMYPLMVFFACAMGLFLDRYKIKSALLLIVLSLFYSWRTLRYIPVWQSNLTLWSHSLQLNPNGWMGWAGLGDGQTAKASQLSPVTQNTERQFWYAQAEASYITALRQQVPTEWAAGIFFSLSIVNLKQGKISLADEHARRAIALNPNLEKPWRNVRFPLENRIVD